jgi:glucose/mannose transport system substrate-binding protein
LIDQYVAAGFCEPITDLYQSEGWTEVMPEDLIAQATEGGEQYSVPVGVHRGNGFWYSRQVMEDAGVTVGETMTIDDFFAAADALQAKGVPALAMGTKDAFVAAQTFENTLLAVVGPDSYNQLFAGEMGWDDQGVKDAMDVFARMLDYVNDDHPALTWDGATALVIENRAGFNSMGDWAYGEVVAKEAVEGTGWVSHPGTQGSFVLVVDSFTLPVGAPNPENARAWLQVLGHEGGAGGVQPAEGLDPGPDRRRPVDLLPLPTSGRSPRSARTRWSRPAPTARPPRPSSSRRSTTPPPASSSTRTSTPSP